MIQFRINNKYLDINQNMKVFNTKEICDLKIFTILERKYGKLKLNSVNYMH